MATQRNISPTLTMAQLYEAQKQYLDAYAIYHKIFLLNQSEEIKDKMLSAEAKFYADESVEYAKFISEIFTPEDLQMFRILPEQSYINYEEAMNKELFDELEPIDEEIKENDDEPSPEKEMIEEEFVIAPPPGDEEMIQELPNPENLFPPTDNEKKSDTGDYLDALLVEPPPLPKPKKKTSSKPKDIMDISVTKLATYLKKNYKKGTKLSELTLGDIKKIINDLL